MTLLTFIIPIGKLHQDIAGRAIDSIVKQTVKCSYLGMVDTQQQGPAKLRNELLKQVKTPFVSFLDADDWIEPTFAADLIQEFERLNRAYYIYPDWFKVDGSVVETPCLTVNGQPVSSELPAYCGGTWHPITTLLPTEWAMAVGGFDESLPADEDTDFYLKLCSTSHCGRRLAKPLFHYSPNGGRSLAYYQSEQFKVVKDILSKRYIGKKSMCCGDEKPLPPVGAKLDGDVQAMALWSGNHTTQGKATGRIYAYMSYPKTTWVSPLDIRAAPHEWKEVIVEAPIDQGQTIRELQTLANIGMSTVKQKAVDYSVPVNEPAPPPVTGKPDIANVLRLAQANDDPIFVFPETVYPSYADIRRLVELSGFKSTTFKKINVYSRQPLIIVSPEVPPDLEGVPSRVIYWQLEYAGDYTHNYDNIGGELWASDPSWASAHGAKYVPMGSHQGLATYSKSSDPEFQLTMLAYMTPRRQMLKNRLASLTWPVDYPGHGSEGFRDRMLSKTWLMVNVHQHENAAYFAPQRLTIAAANKMPVFHEMVSDKGIFANAVAFMNYDDMPNTILNAFGKQWGQAQRGFVSLGERLYKLLCEENTFESCVRKALKS